MRVRVDLLLVLHERVDLVGAEVADLGQADAVLAGDHAAEVDRELHDAVDHAVGLVKHAVVVRVHRDVGVHIAITGVHVQRDEQAVVLQRDMFRAQRDTQRLQFLPAENLAQALLDFIAVGHAHVTAQHQVQQAIVGADRGLLGFAEYIGVRARGIVHAIEQARPARAHPCQMLARKIELGLENRAALVAGLVVAVLPQLSEIARKMLDERVDALDLVRDRLFDVDALDAGVVFDQAVQRDHHVLVDLERIGVRRDRRGARTVVPETSARFRADRDETLAVAGVHDRHQVRRDLRDSSLSSSPAISASSTMRGRSRPGALVA